MASLLERLQQRTGTTPTSQQEEIQRVLQAKKGKAPLAPGVKGTKLAESQAIAAGQAGIREQVTAGQIKAKELAAAEKDIEARGKMTEEEIETQKELTLERGKAEEQVRREELSAEEQLNADRRESKRYIELSKMTQHYDQGLQDLTTKRGIAIDDMFAKYEQNLEELKLDKEASQFDQMLHNITYSNRAYADALTRIGEERRLVSETQWEQEVTETLLGKEMELFKELLGFDIDIRMTKRDLDKKLKAMEIEQQYNFAKLQGKGAQNTALVNGISTIAAEGVEYKYGSTTNTGSK